MEEISKCDVTGKPAKVFVTQIVGDKVWHGKFCLEAAVAKGLFHEQAFDLLGEPSGEERAQLGSSGRCPSCGHSLALFQKTGRLGCPECWATFSKALDPLMGRIHRGKQHLGKAPQQHRTPELDHRLRLDLRHRLDAAVRREFFEEAAELRDQLRALES